MIVEQRKKRFSRGDALPANGNSHAVQRRLRQSRVEQNIKPRLARELPDRVAERNVLQFNQRDGVVFRGGACPRVSADDSGYRHGHKTDRSACHFVK